MTSVVMRRPRLGARLTQLSTKSMAVAVVGTSSIDPKAKSLEVDERRGELFGSVETFGKDDVVRAVPFDACEINLASLWLADEAQP